MAGSLAGASEDLVAAGSVQGEDEGEYRMTSMKEIDLAIPLIAWLDSHGFEVYQEVQVNGDTADIVAVLHGKLVHVIEVKTALSMAVLAQADRWRHYAHWRSVAVPHLRRNGAVHPFTMRICQDYGIGMFYIGRDISERIPPAFNRKVRADIVLKTLRPEHKTYAQAGSSNGRRWTPFAATCTSIARYVANHPGCDLKTLVGSIDTHYASKSCASHCISHWAQAGKVQGIRCVRDGKHLRFFVSESPES